jgi:hypothetical protein
MQYCQQPAAEIKSAWLLTQSTDAACSHSSSSQPASGGGGGRPHPSNVGLQLWHPLGTSWLKLGPPPLARAMRPMLTATGRKQLTTLVLFLCLAFRH